MVAVVPGRDRLECGTDSGGIEEGLVGSVLIGVVGEWGERG